MLGSMTALAGLLSLLHPIAARAGGIGTLVALRVGLGLVQVCGFLIQTHYSELEIKKLKEKFQVLKFAHSILRVYMVEYFVDLINKVDMSKFLFWC